MTELVHLIKKIFPKLEDDLVTARSSDSIETYSKKMVIGSVFITLLLTIISFFILNIKIALLVFIVAFVGSFWFFANYPKGRIKKREKAIKQNLLFAGRYLLIKVESGEPLFLSLIGVSKSYGETGKAFRDIVQDIHFGSSIEGAIDRAIKHNPCKDLTRILWELSNSIKTGTDISKSLRAILDSISREYLIEIEKYGKKLNSLTLFYLVAGIIFPSLGMTMFVVLSSFIGIEIPGFIFYVAGALLILMQLFFVSLFRAARPAMSL